MIQLITGFLAIASPWLCHIPISGWLNPPICQPVKGVQILNQDTCLSALLCRHHYQARVEVNAGLYSRSSFLSRPNNIQMLVAPQSICALTCCMLLCLCSTRVGLVVAAATAVSLPVWLSAFINSLWKPQCWWKVGTASFPGLMGLVRLWIPSTRSIGIVRIAWSVICRFRNDWSGVAFLIARFQRLPRLPFLFSLVSGLLPGSQRCRCAWCPDSASSLNFALGSRCCRFRGKIALMFLCFPTDDCTQLICRNAIQFLSLIWSDPVLMIIVLIVGNAPSTRISLWNVLYYHQDAQLNDEMFHVPACSNRASICHFEGSNLTCWLDNVACW